MKVWYLLHMQAAQAQMSLRIHKVRLGPSFLSHNAAVATAADDKFCDMFLIIFFLKV